MSAEASADADSIQKISARICAEDKSHRRTPWSQPLGNKCGGRGVCSLSGRGPLFIIIMITPPPPPHHLYHL
jgi:hypothetical protein